MTHENKITPAASALLCNHSTWQNTTLLLISMRYLIQSRSRRIAVFDMSTAILHNTFKPTTPLIDATVN